MLLVAVYLVDIIVSIWKMFRNMFRYLFIVYLFLLIFKLFFSCFIRHINFTAGNWNRLWMWNFLHRVDKYCRYSDIELDISSSRNAKMLRSPRLFYAFIYYIDVQFYDRYPTFMTLPIIDIFILSFSSCLICKSETSNKCI